MRRVFEKTNKDKSFPNNWLAMLSLLIFKQQGLKQKEIQSGHKKRAVIPINSTSVLMVILQEKQKTNSGLNQAPYDNKTITKNVQNCVAHLLVAFKGQICAFQHQKFNKNCLLCQSSIYFLSLALMNHELNFGISVTFFTVVPCLIFLFLYKCLRICQH